jgi:hypothetical protein
MGWLMGESRSSNSSSSNHKQQPQLRRMRLCSALNSARHDQEWRLSHANECFGDDRDAGNNTTYPSNRVEHTTVHAPQRDQDITTVQ